MIRGGAYDRAVRGLSAIYVVIGTVILALTLARGGGPLSIGVLLGLAFIALGVGRIVIQRRIGGDR